MINTQYINLNMVPSGVMPVLYCSQYDIGRPLGMVVYNGGEAVGLDTYTCTIEATRTDGTAITAAVTTDDNIGAFVTTATMTNQADRYPAKLVLFDSQSRRVASLAFVMVVTAKTMDENAESIQEDESLYQQYTGTVQALIADIRSQLTDLKNHTDWYVIPQDYGAKGDGVTDDTVAFQNAINQFGTLFVPSGSYVVNGLVLKEGTKIVGENELNTVILTNGFNTRTGNEDISRMAFSNLTFIGSGTCLDLSGSTTSPFTGGRYSKLKNLTFRNFTIGILERGCWCVDHDSVRFINCDTAVRQEGSCNNIVYDHCIITGIDAQTQTGVRIVADGGAENYNVDFMSCCFENLDVAVNAYAVVSLNFDNPYVEKVTTFLNATNLLGAKGSGGNFNGIGRLLNLSKTSAEFWTNTGISYDSAYIKLDSGTEVAYPTDGTYADLKNFVSSQKAYLSHIDAGSMSGCSGNYDTASVESNRFNIRYTSSAGTFSTPHKRRFDSFKIVAARLIFAEAATTERNVQVNLANGTTIIGTASVPQGTHAAGDTITVGLDASVLGNRIMDDLSGLTAKSTDSASSSNVNMTATLDLLVAEMMTRTN